MVYKRGQLTIFIIVAIIVIGFVILFFAFQTGLIKQPINPESDPFRLFVQDCMDQTAQDAIYFIGLQGGYSNVPNPKENYSSIEIPIYWNINEINLPSEDTIENEIFNHFKAEFQNCLGDFSNFKEQVFDVTAKEIKGDVVFSKNNMKINLDYPLFFKSQNSSVELRDFTTDVNVDFNQKHDIVRQILEEQQRNPDSIPL